MKDRREKTFKILVDARERQIKALETQLAALRFEYAELQQATAQKREALAQKMQEESERNAQMQAMMSGGGTFKVDELYKLRQYQGIVSERRAQFEAECAQAEQAEQAKQNEIHAIQHQISKNQAQRDEYKKLLTKIKNKAFKTAEDAQDESAEEALVAQRRFSR